jgi:hypothetical protein
LCTFNILYDLKAVYTNSSKKDCIQEQQQEIPVQANTVVFTTGLPGRPPITQFPALPAEQDTVCRAQRMAHRKIRVSGWDTRHRPEDTKSYLPRGPEMRHA